MFPVAAAPYSDRTQTAHERPVMSAPRLNTAALALLAALGASVGAQTTVPDAFVGHWKLESQTAAGRPWQGRLELAADGTGKLQTYGVSRSNTCVGKAAPTMVESAEPTQIKVRAKLSEVITGCEDMVFVLKTADNGTLTGQRGSGAAVTAIKD